jgi:uncharacterized protein
MADKSRHGARRDSRSPYAISVSRLGLRPGSMITVQETVSAPSRVGVDLVAIPAGAPVELDLSLHSVSEGVAVSGTVSAPTEGECARCLTPVTGHVEIDITDFFAYADSVTEATTEEDEVGHVVDDAIDLEQSIIDAVGLQLPFSPLCQDDCPGLCVECGVPLATAGADHHHDVIDPRWAKLAAIKTAEEEPSDRGSGGHE